MLWIRLKYYALKSDGGESELNKLEKSKYSTFWSNSKEKSFKYIWKTLKKKGHFRGNKHLRNPFSICLESTYCFSPWQV